MKQSEIADLINTSIYIGMHVIDFLSKVPLCGCDPNELYSDQTASELGKFFVQVAKIETEIA